MSLQISLLNMSSIKRTFNLWLFILIQAKENVNKPNLEARDQNTLDIFTKLTDAQRHLFANKLSELPEMSKYSQGTESYPQFAVRIAEMLLDAEKFKELYPYLVKVGFQTK